VAPLERAGLRMLVNETVRVRVGEARLLVAGPDDVNRFYTDAADGRSRATAAVQDYLTLAPSGPRAARAADMLAATPR
jgi:hypothetical protein